MTLRHYALLFKSVITQELWRAPVAQDNYQFKCYALAPSSLRSSSAHTDFGEEAVTSREFEEHFNDFEEFSIHIEVPSRVFTSTTGITRPSPLFSRAESQQLIPNFSFNRVFRRHFRPGTGVLVGPGGSGNSSPPSTRDAQDPAAAGKTPGEENVTQTQFFTERAGAVIDIPCICEEEADTSDRSTMGATQSSSVDMSGREAMMVKHAIETNPVVVFSKTQCPYCVTAKGILREMGVEMKVLELDRMEQGDRIQDILGQMTNARTVPRVFINGQCIGGCSELKQLEKNGKLSEMFQSMY